MECGYDYDAYTLPRPNPSTPHLRLQVLGGVGPHVALQQARQHVGDGDSARVLRRVPPDLAERPRRRRLNMILRLLRQRHRQLHHTLATKRGTNSTWRPNGELTQRPRRRRLNVVLRLFRQRHRQLHHALATKRRTNSTWRPNGELTQRPRRLRCLNVVLRLLRQRHRQLHHALATKRGTNSTWRPNRELTQRHRQLREALATERWTNISSLTAAPRP